MLNDKSKTYLECVMTHQVRQEKVDLENQLEKEQEYIVNKLQKQLSQVSKNSALMFKHVVRFTVSENL
jgi:Uncharacterized conserved protein H4 (DUF2046)